jgi:hypothetical protein
MSLAEALRGVLKAATMTVGDAAAAVKKAGYKSTSPNFKNMVSQALLANKKRFKRVARGQYTAR